MVRLSAVACLTATATALTASSSTVAAWRSPLNRSPRTRPLLAQGGWITAVDQASGQTYYYNEQTGATQWDAPAEMGSTPQAAAAPSGWISAVDEASGQTYYYNEQTGATQWEPPVGMGNTPAQVLWRIAAYNGVAGFSGVAGFAAENKYQHYQLEFGNEGRPCQLPYTLGVGDEHVLSRWNMIEQRLTVSRVQSTLRCNADGSTTLTSEGKGATLWREPGGMWNTLQKGEQVTVAHGDQVSLDFNEPEAAVFEIQQEGAAMQGGYY